MSKFNRTIPLTESHPSLAGEWNFAKNSSLSPNDVSAGSNKKVWWLGKCGHEWQAVISSRSNGCGCPVCSGRQILSGFNDLATLNPELAKEWHPSKNSYLAPNTISPNSHKKAWWKCSTCGNEWEAQIKSRNTGNGCSICGKQKQIETSRINALRIDGVRSTRQNCGKND